MPTRVVSSQSSVFSWGALCPTFGHILKAATQRQETAATENRELRTDPPPAGALLARPTPRRPSRPGSSRRSHPLPLLPSSRASLARILASLCSSFSWRKLAFSHTLYQLFSMAMEWSRSSRAPSRSPFSTEVTTGPGQSAGGVVDVGLDALLHELVGGDLDGQAYLHAVPDQLQIAALGGGVGEQEGQALALGGLGRL